MCAKSRNIVAYDSAQIHGLYLIERRFGFSSIDFFSIIILDRFAFQFSDSYGFAGNKFIKLNGYQMSQSKL
jgi:hypothetical protein